MIGRRRFTRVAASALSLPFLAGAGGPRRLRLAFGSGFDNPFGVACQELAKQVANRTEGRFAVDIYPDATLGNDEALLASVHAGTLDLTAVSSALLAEYAPEIGLLDLPFLFRDNAHARTALDGDNGQELAELAKAKGLTVLAWGENGVRHLTGHRPIRNAADLQGLKLRVLPAPLLINAFRAMGAQAEALPFSQLYEALLTGRFEAQENTLQQIRSARLNEVQSHVTLTAHSYSAMAIVVSPDLIEDLDPADRKALNEAAHAAATQSRDYVSRTDELTTAALRNAGMTFVTDPDRENLRAAAAPAEAQAAARLGADRIARLRRA